MAATSSGRRDRQQKGTKGGTESSRRHRFESFNQRIAKLNIDPVRRTRGQNVEQDDMDNRTSFFKTGLAHWQEINLSANFTAFVREVKPLCDSLPQILHYEQKIMDTIYKYTERLDVLSLEPLLSLISHLAHDLGPRFEGHFAGAVALLASIAAKHLDVEAIEWSFNCLAWLFKYLSRLLVPDLRAAYDIMAPLLGQERQKKFITRFGAEAMSFLVRKAALAQQRGREFLTILVDHVLLGLRDCEQQDGDTMLYQYGIMTLFADVIKGVNRGVHSSGSTTYKTLLTAVDTQRPPNAAMIEILRGVTVNIIHHTDEVTFSPILEVLTDRIKEVTSFHMPAPSCVSVISELLYVVAGVRKGSRILNWEPMLNSSIALLKLGGAWCHKDSANSMDCIEKSTVVILHHSPLNLVIPKVRWIVECMLSGPRRQNFLPFCNYFFKLDREKFQSLVRPTFYKYLASDWSKMEAQLLLTGPQMLEEQPVDTEKPQRQIVPCPQSLQQHVVALFTTAIVDETPFARLNAYIDLTKVIYLDQSAFEAVVETLLNNLRAHIASDLSPNLHIAFTLGAGLEAILRHRQVSEIYGNKLWSQLCSIANVFGTMPCFLTNLLTLCETSTVDLSSVVLEPLVSTLIKNLATPSSTLRKVSLLLLKLLYRKLHSQDADVLITAITIETTPLDLESARIASMHVRRLSSQYYPISSDPWLGTAVPFFCFGLFTFKLAQLWEDAVDILKIICETKVGEKIVSEVAFQWLEQPPVDTGDVATFGGSETPCRDFAEFCCSNLTRLDKVAMQQSKTLKNADAELQNMFNARHNLLSRAVPNASSHALRIFAGIPHIAEKRSRKLVPLFLRWALVEEQTHAVATNQGFEQKIEHLLPGSDHNQRQLARNDYKAMLKLFGSFSNPRVLFKAPQVFEALLRLLTNGDAEIQKFALGAISTWKLEGVQPYMENLTNLLDGSRFREEISVFLQNDEENGTIQPGHREELMPVLLRILYGRTVARSGSSNSSGSQTARRKAVLAVLLRLSDRHIEEFLFIALGSLRDLEVVRDLNGRVIRIQAPSKLALKTRNQMGIVTMMKDMLETMGGRLSFLLQYMINATLYCMCCAGVIPTDDLESPDNTNVEGLQASLRKVIRQVGLQCLIDMFKYFSPQELDIYLGLIFSEIVNPRLEKLPIEMAQSVSGLLQLFATWVTTPQNATHLVIFNPLLLEKLVDCLGVASAKDEVKLFVIDAVLKPCIANIGPLVDQQPSLDLKVSHILEQAGSLMRRSPSKQLLESTIELISLAAPFVRGSAQVEGLLDVSDFLLGQPSRRVSPRAKGDLLQIAQQFIPLLNLKQHRELQDRLVCTMSSLFGYFKDRANRNVLCNVFTRLAEQDVQLQIIAPLCTDLNSFSAESLEEPDFERRLKAFNSINETKFSEFTPRQWLPVVYNMLFYIRDTEELAIRSNASYALRRFVEASHAFTSTTEVSNVGLLENVVLPALRHGASEHSELVRAEYVSIMAHLIRCKPEWNEVEGMVPLLVADDEEASFFNNILHIQHHRRIRALRRLAVEAKLLQLESSNIAHFLVPLLEHFIFDKAEDENAHNLAAEATNTIGALAEGLEWPQLRALFRRICSYIYSKPGLEKSIIKLIGALIDAVSRASFSKQQHLTFPQEHATNCIEIASNLLTSSQLSNLAATMPKQEKLSDDIIKNLLPTLQAYLHDKDESAVSLRVRVAVSIVKMLKLLPQEEFTQQFSPLLTDVSHILRSRAQDSRDMTRKTLVEISTLTGPLCFGFILKELKSSLARGYQLHVLSYTIHSMLVEAASIFKPGDLDYCIPQIVEIIMNDIFGPTGQEKDAEEYISKMKEVKSSKSFDSMELVAKTATIGHISDIVIPLQVLLEEQLDLKSVKKIDELFRRIGVGLLRNEAIKCRETLVFCFEILTDIHKANNSSNDKSSKGDHHMKRYLVASTGSKSSGGKPKATSLYSYKLARFSLDVLRSILHKYESLQTPTNLSGFMPAIGDALFQAQEEVQISALRLLSTIVRVPLREIDDNSLTYVAEAVKIIKNTSSTNTELAQAALKLISAILRERHQVMVRDSDIAYLCKRLKPDLEEPDRQGITFNFLRAVMARKVILPEVYEVLDVVAAMMVTNQTRGARDLARGVYFQFLLSYPQGKDRLSKQFAFLVKNLDYKHAEGRQSIMEAIHLLLTKLGGDMAQDLVGTFFVPLVMVTVNDESFECRKMAGVLLKELFEKADADRTQNFLTLLRTWMFQEENGLLTRVSIQTLITYVEINSTKAENDVPLFQTRITDLLQAGNRDIMRADWETLYFSLQLASKLCTLFPFTLLQSKSALLWESVRQSLWFPHAWVKLAAAKLLGVYFADFVRTNSHVERPGPPLRGSAGLCLDSEEMLEVVKASLSSLKVPGISEELALQSVRNLVFLSRFVGRTLVTSNSLQHEMSMDGSDEEAQDEDGNEFTVNTDPRPNSKTVIQYIFERLSAILRREPVTTKAPSLVPKTAALQLIAALCNHLSGDTISQSIETVLLSLHNLTDSLIPAPFSSDEAFRTTYQALVSTSQEIMALLQKKLGTTEYVKQLTRVRDGVKMRREGRRIKRRLEVVSEPEKVGRDKKRKGEKKREKRRERSGEMRERRRGW